MAVATQRRKPKQASALFAELASIAHIVCVEATNHKPEDCWVDEAAGVIFNVLALGRESKNIPTAQGKPLAGVTKGTRYSDSAIASAANVMEGCKVHKNHPPRSAPHTEREPDTSLGVFRNCRPTSDGVRADFHYNRQNPFNAQVVEDVKRRMGQWGFSPIASGTFSVRDGVCVMEEVKAVRSVDLVDDPATTVTIWNSNQERPAMKIAELFESLVPKLKGKRRIALCEFMEADAYMTAPEKKADAMEDDVQPPAMGDMAAPDVAPEASPEDALKSGFETALHALATAALEGSMDEGEAVKKFKELLGHYTKITAGDSKSDSGGGDAKATTAEGDAEPDSDDEKKKKADSKESKQMSDADRAELIRLREERKVVQLCEKKQFKPTAAQLDYLADVAEAKREQVIADLAASANRTQPRSFPLPTPKQKTEETKPAGGIVQDIKH